MTHNLFGKARRWSMILISGVVWTGTLTAGQFDTSPFEERYPYRAFYDCKETPCIRKTVAIPEGQIFSAIVRLNWNGKWYINGQEITGTYRDLGGGQWCYWIIGADIRKYLKPGKNVFATDAGWYAYLDGQVIMADGAVIKFGTDGSWKGAKTTPEDWKSDAFDDSSWPLAKAPGTKVYYSENRMPPYHGRLVIENPYQEKLFYYDGNDVKFDVRIPVELAGKEASIAYKVCQVDTGKEVYSGQVDTFSGHADKVSAIYRIDLGPVGRGVYTLSLSLNKAGQVIEQHEHEPFIVAGKIPQPVVSGNSFEEGMDLKLIDTINCSDSNDPHPFREGANASRIAGQDGLKCREAGAKRGSWFAYKAKLLETDVPYLFVFEYPENQARAIEAQVNEFHSDPKFGLNEKNLWGWARESAGAFCSEPFSGKMEKLPVLCWPGKKEVFLTVATARDNQPAATGKILIYRVGAIPALEVRQGGRWFGKFTERAYSFHKMCDGIPIEDSHYYPSGDYWSPKNFAQWFKAIERFVQYMKFCGENTYVMGCLQYTWGNSAYTFPQLIGGKTSRLEPDYREVLAAVFSANELNLLGTMEMTGIINNVRKVLPTPTKEELQAGADTAWCVSFKGDQLISSEGAAGGVPNLLHPLVWHYWTQIEREICEKLTPFPAFKGFFYVGCPGVEGFVPGHSAIWATSDPISWLQWDYSDVTIRRFEKDTGIRIPVDSKDPERFKKRYDWVMANAKEPWIQWRCAMIKGLVLETLKVMRACRKDLELIYGNEFWDIARDKFLKSEVPLEQWYRYDGWDMKLYKNLAGVRLCRWICSMDYPDDIALYAEVGSRAVNIKNIFDENPIVNEYTNEWPFKALLMSGPCVAGGERFGDQFIRACGHSDLNMLFFGFMDDQILVGHEQAVREFAKGFLPLPAEELNVVQGPGIDPNVIVRSGRAGNQTVIFLANPGWWQNQVELELEVEGEAQIWDLATGEEIKPKRKENKLRVTITLPPYGTRSLGISGASPAVKGVSSRPDDSGQKGLSAMLERVKNIMAGDRVRQVLPEEDLSFMDSSVQKAEEALKGGQLTASWAYLAAPGFCQILNDKAKRIESIIPWLVIGPFPNSAEFIKKEDEGVAGVASDDAKDEYCQGFNEEFEAEKDVLAQGAPLRDKAYQGALNQELKWRKALTIRRDGHAYLDFLAYFKPQNWTVGYAWTRVYADKEQPAKLVTGSDDGLKVWVNGQLAQSVLKARGANWGDDRKEMKLKKGENWVLVKVENRRGGYGFYLDFVDKDLQPLANLKYSPLGKDKR